MARTDASIPLIVPDWPAPDSVQAVSTTRVGGVSRSVYAHLNLGTHVGDDGHAVQANRRALIAQLGLSDRPRWLEQVHGVKIAAAEGICDPSRADGSIAGTRGVACVVMTADCLPVLLCDTSGTQVAAIHGGWRGLVGGILEAALDAFVGQGLRPEDLLAWLGPAIGPEHYEVGPEVRDAGGSDWRAAFSPGVADRWQLDLYRLARLQLAALGIENIYGGEYCTYADERFFSHRRDGLCGRQATLIWLKS
jgi:YfiH family protein